MDVEDVEARELMRRYANGEDALFERLYAVLAPRLYRFCQRLARARAEGDDYFQETLLRLHRARATYQAQVNPLYWAFAIARSVHLTQLRYRERHPEAVGVAGDATESCALAADDRYDPEAQTRAQDLVQVITRALQKLSEKNRSAYVLLREEGLDVRDAATILGTTVDAVKQRAHRAAAQVGNAVRIAGWTLADAGVLGARREVKPDSMDLCLREEASTR
jgi:RNA polymerase sigma-70 factor, ECF subfamily